MNLYEAGEVLLQTLAADIDPELASKYQIDHGSTGRRNIMLRSPWARTADGSGYVQGAAVAWLYHQYSLYPFTCCWHRSISYSPEDVEAMYWLLGLEATWTDLHETTIRAIVSSHWVKDLGRV